MSVASTLGAYTALLGARFRVLLQYRAAALAGLGTQIFWGFIRIMIFEAFYAAGSDGQPMSLAEVVTYVWLTQALLLLLPFRGDNDVRDMIRSGNLAYELARPLDLFNVWYARAIALRTAPALLRSLPMFALALPFFGMQPPASAGSALAWAATTVGALLVASAITVLMNLTLLWTTSGDGINRLLSSVTIVLSGGIIPLPLFPDWAQGALNLLPFRAIMDVPFRMYMGHIAPGEVWGALAHQLAWAAILILLGRWALARGLGRVAVQGG